MNDLSESTFCVSVWQICLGETLAMSDPVRANMSNIVLVLITKHRHISQTNFCCAWRTTDSPPIQCTGVAPIIHNLFVFRSIYGLMMRSFFTVLMNGLNSVISNVVGKTNSSPGPFV